MNYDSRVGVISSLVEVDEVECEDDQNGITDNAKILKKTDFEVPHYEKVLRDLFGRETANGFIHPKVDESVGVAGMAASLRSQKITGVMNIKRYKKDSQLNLSTIQTNAQRLWEMLRENSINSIQKEDSKVNPELKDSFNAFARGFIERNMTPPQRSFIEDKELIEMRKRMKSKKLSGIDLISRKKHLMFDLSELQEGNQAMLLRDKSFLTTNEISNKELLFPPLMEEPTNVKVTEKVRHNKTYHQMLTSLDVDIVNEDSLFRDSKKESVNLKFFRESDSLDILKERNLFRDNICKKIGGSDTFMGQTIDKTRLWMTDDPKARLEGNYGGIKESKKSRNKGTPLSYQKEVQSKTWQPLTLGAVMDFKLTKKPTFTFDDNGEFRRGACKLWRPKLAVG